MKTICTLATLVIACCLFACKQAAQRTSEPQSILIYSATKGFRHESIPDGVAALKKIAANNNWNAIATEDSSIFNPTSLKQFSAIVMLNTTGNILDESGQKALQEYIRGGGGLAGVHAATDCEYDWPWYNQLIGGYFASHPSIQTARIQITKDHSSTRHLGKEWIRKDEWYNFKSLSPAITVIMNLDEKSYTGGKMGDSHPAAWYQEFDGGKVFYTALGHTKESYSEPEFLKHVEEGVRSVMK